MATQLFDRDLVRRIAIIKCWETRWAFDADSFLAGLPEGKYEWTDLRRLVKRGWTYTPEQIVRSVQQGYGFLREMTEDEAMLAADPYGRERQAYQRLLASLHRAE